uniref:Si:ch211-256e16.11 n=1 Tax=Sinocyclocheilus anshuiensis TaxID=1608454 RepID=A0A671MIN5_9TELE
MGLKGLERHEGTTKLILFVVLTIFLHIKSFFVCVFVFFSLLATRVEDKQSYPDHPERFDHHEQVLCGESMTGRCYWEAEWSGMEVVISVTYKGMNRKGGSDCWFGYNDKSWSLFYSKNRSNVCHNNVSNTISDTSSCIYLDCLSGTLSFYSVSDTHTLTHIYTFNTTLTEPLYAGFGVYPESSVSLCQI